METSNMTKGERISLTKDDPGLTKVRVELSWSCNTSGGGTFDLDASAFMLDANGKLTDEKHFVYFNNKTSPEGSVWSSGDNLTGGSANAPDETLFVDLSKVPANVDQIDFIVNIYEAVKKHQNFGQVPKASIVIKRDSDNKELAKYDLEENFSSETAIHPGSIYRKDGGWAFKAVGAGYQRDLTQFLSHYKAA